MNTFPRYHRYVPILRWKYAEADALCQLFKHGTDTSRLTPLIELLPSDFEVLKAPNVTNAINEIADEITNYWGYEQPLYIDFGGISTAQCMRNGTHALGLLHQASYLRFDFIPVIRLNSDPELVDELKKVLRRGNRSSISNEDLGICLRVTANEIVEPCAEANIQHLLTRLGISQTDVDLLVDFKLISGTGLDYASIYANVPASHIWRRLIFAGGVWPENLAGFTAGDRHELNRAEWHAWQALINGLPKSSRPPEYADYTITHPDFSKEPPEMQIPVLAFGIRPIRHTSFCEGRD